MSGKIFYILLVICFFGLIVSVIAGALDYRGTTFYGREQFDTFEQAQEYQTKIITEAQRVGAKVDEFTLSVQSPPKVGWRVKMPQTIWDKNHEDFLYGERGSSITSAKIFSVVAWITLVIWLLVVLGVILFPKWFERWRKNAA
jgi:Flp pilus assembly protein TadB